MQDNTLFLLIWILFVVYKKRHKTNKCFLNLHPSNHYSEYKNLFYAAFTLILQNTQRREIMDTTRLSKVGKQIQKDLSEILGPLTPSLAPGKMLTVTRVRVSPDLGIAKTYISVFPSTDAEEAIKTLNAQVGQIRHILGQKIRHQVRKVPELKFFLDDSLDYIDNIDHLLKD